MEKIIGPELNPRNELIKELVDTEWVKNPLIYSQISGDFTPMQTNVMVELVNTLQDKINDYLKVRRTNTSQQLTLFTPEEMSAGEVKFTIPIKELGVTPNAYDELEKACYKLLKLDMVYRTKDTMSGVESVVMANIFSKIKFPTSDVSREGIKYNYAGGKRRTGFLEIYMLSDNVSKVFDMRRGYVEHVRHIVSFCHRRQSPRVYIYLSRWKRVGHKTVNFLEFKEYLGLLRYNAKRTEVVQNKYPKFAMFCSMVMDPIRDEMNALAAANKIDFFFDYVPNYSNGKKRGDPESITFNIHLSEMGQYRKESSQNHQSRTAMEEILRTEYCLTEADLGAIRELLKKSMIPYFQREVEGMKQKVETFKPRSVRAYVTQCLKNYLRQLALTMPEACEEVPMESEVAEPMEEFTKPRLTEDDLACWNLFTQMVQETIGEQQYHTWFSESTLYSVEKENVTIEVPTHLVAEHIESHLLAEVRDALYAAFGEGCKLQYRMAEKG